MTADRGDELDGGLTLPDAPGAKAGAPPDVRGGTLGRFVLLEVLGAGGMGIVYAAYDPQLDRKVALKLLHPDDSSEEARARLLREAQAMAKINHPNVVTVHEAGTLGEQVYVAMEFCDGGTLRTWLAEKTRSRREILDAFAQAGLGLAAAHDAGLVHRDFKPQNVLVGNDGVVRVTDFGLASFASGSGPPELVASLSASTSTPLSQKITRTGATIGTPSYMAPEQFARRTASPRTDQFAFCVALYEALYGEPPFPAESPLALSELVQLGRVSAPPAGTDVPGWLRGVLLRGLSVDDAKRFPTIRELLAAIARDPGRRLRRWGLGIAGAAAFVGLVMALRPSHGAECNGGGERRATVWNLERRARLAGAFLASGRSYAAHDLGRSSELVDAWASSWEAGYHDACIATRVRGEQSENLLDRRMQCLMHKLQEAGATIDLLANGGHDALDHALDALLALPSVAPCADATALLADAEPPADLPTKSRVAAIEADIARARGEEHVGNYRRAFEVASNAVAVARTVQYPPILADALIERGGIELDLSERTAADTLDEAMRTSARLGAWPRFVDAAARLVFTLANDTNRHDAATEIAAIADGVAEHTNVPAEVAIRLDDSVGQLLQREGHPAEAKVRYERAIARGEKDLAPDAPQLVSAIGMLSILSQEQGHLDDAERLSKRALELREQAYGPDHPAVSGSLNNLAIVYKLEHKFREAKQLYERALAIRVAALGPEHPDVAQIYQNLGSLASEQGDSRAAIDYSRKALALLEKRYGPDSFQIVGALDNVGTFLGDTGDYPAARALVERAVHIVERTFGPDHIALASPLQNLAVIVMDEGKLDEATALNERTLRILKRAYGPDHPDVADLELNASAVLRRQHKYKEAVAMLQQGLAAVKKAYGEHHGHVGMALVNLGALYEDMEDFPAALGAYEEALPILEASFGKDHVYCSYPLIGMANELVTLHRAREALPLAERGLAMRIAQPNPHLLAEARFTHATVLDALGDHSGALADARAALAGFESIKSQDNIDRVRAWLAKQ